MIIKQKLYNYLEKPYLEKYGYLFQLSLVFIILVNIFSFVIPLIFPLSLKNKEICKYIENTTLFLFAVELILRYYSIGIDKKYTGFKGRIKYSFNIYTLIDIFVLIPYIFFFQTNLMLFRLIRILRFLRFKKTIKKYFSIFYFSKLSLSWQITILLFLSIVIILIFSIAFHSIKISASIFMDPPNITEVNGYFYIFIGIVELIFGLIIGGALISIITEYLSNTVENIKKGYFPYKQKNHIVIINYNQKLEIILNELNLYFKDNKTEQDVVIFLPNSNIDVFSNNLPSYSNINIFLITGSMFHKVSYERLNLAYAKKVIILKNENINVNKLLKFIIKNISFRYKVKFIIEVDNLKYNDNIYKEMLKDYKFTLISSNDVIKKAIKRAIINYNYFKILQELLSFDGYEFYVENFTKFFNDNKTFFEVFNSFEKGIAVGVVKDDNLMLNPNSDFLIKKTDKLILLLENPDSYKLVENNFNDDIDIFLKQPLLKEFKKISIVGDYTDIKKDDLDEFLSDDAKQYLQNFTHKNYYDLNFWKELDKKFDLIILNLEDEFEFNLTLYLKSVLSEKILNKIVNIINSPLEAYLLANDSKNIIISEDLSAKYITQNLFNDYIPQIFYEITHSFGSELYILHKNDYKNIFKYDFRQFKNILLKNNIIYLGAFIDDNFIFEYDNLKNIEDFVVIAKGV